MLKGLANATTCYSGLVLAVVGDGSLADKLAKDAEQIVPGRVRWVGRVNNTEMAGYYQAADLMLLSSNRESAARVISESLLAGTPVLSTDTAGALEVIENRVTGFVTPVGDLDAYSEALVELCSDVGRLAEMGEIGREQMASRVTAVAVTRQMKMLYEKALEKSN